MSTPISGEDLSLPDRRCLSFEVWRSAFGATSQALKLGRLSGCLLGGPGLGGVPSRGAGVRRRRAVQGNHPSFAVQLSAGVRPQIWKC